MASGLIESNDVQLDTSFLRSGIYILRISNQTVEQVEKFIKTL